MPCSAAVLPGRTRHVDSRANGSADCVHLLRHFAELDRLLGEHRAGTGFPLGRILPLFLDLSDGWAALRRANSSSIWPLSRGRLWSKTSSKMASTSSSALAGTGTEIPSELRMVLCFRRRTRRMMRSTPVVLAVIGDHPDLRARLPIAVHAPFPLLMTGGVPRQVVMEDGIEVILQVDAFAEAIGRHEYALRGLGQRADRGPRARPERVRR